MTRPFVKLTSSRSWVISSQPARRSAGVMNFVQMSRSLSCFLFIRLGMRGNGLSQSTLSTPRCGERLDTD